MNDNDDWPFRQMFQFQFPSTQNVFVAFDFRLPLQSVDRNRFAVACQSYRTAAQLKQIKNRITKSSQPKINSALMGTFRW